ncbi:hypothetical protein Dimus_034485 [Dionaea muscipula]
MTLPGDEISPVVRGQAVEFLISSAADLQVRPIVKYSALSLFADRFYPSLSSSTRRSRHWLLIQPLRQCNLQLFALISIWISTKFHESRPLSLQSLESYADNRIKDQHFTKRDFLDAEVLLLQALNFDIGMSNTTFVFLEDLYARFREAAKAGECLSFDAAMDILDLLYEEEKVVFLLNGCPLAVAGAVLVASYAVTVPKQRSEFPLLPWLRFVTSCGEEEVLRLVEGILQHIVTPCGVQES